MTKRKYILHKSHQKGDMEVMKSKPDDRVDNVDRIQFNIDKTIQNCELADEMIAKTEDKKMKKTLTEKNERRKETLNSMRKELKDEAMDKQNGFK